MDPDAHAALRAVAGALAPCATVLRSMFRPTRAIQSFSFQRWAPEPREITVTGVEPACDDEPTVFTPSRSLRRMLPPPKRTSTEPMTRRHGHRSALMPGASDVPSRTFATAVW